jgi:type IV secretory pathway ATPase VirB11/archaellum biosynthesis ATPase
MLFKENAPLYATELSRKQGETILYVNYLQAPFVPSLIDGPGVMGRTIEALIRYPEVGSVIFVQQRHYHYTAGQIRLLSEVARLYTFLVEHEKVTSLGLLGLFGSSEALHGDMTYLMDMLRTDPYGCYHEVKRRVHTLRAQVGTGQVVNQQGLLGYVRLLERIQGQLEGLALVKEGVAQGAVSGKALYTVVFRPAILPNFSFTRLAAHYPSGARLVDQYTLTHGEESAVVTILQDPQDAKYIYHLLPPEYTLSEEHHTLLMLARQVLIEHRPQAEEFTDPDKTRAIFGQVARDLLVELSGKRGISLSYRELERLSFILIRHTIGFGILEVLLWDPALQDIVLNAPIARNPIFVKHGTYDACVTTIVPSYEDADSWAGKLRLQSGRPLDEANPILDTDLVFGGIRARVAAIKEPLSPQGLAYALRRHRDQPWTLPLFVQNKMLTSLAGGLLSFLIDGSRTLLVAGTRSSGKTSLLGSLLLEVMPKHRIVVVEDTLELPVDALRDIGYDILRMKVRSALVSGSTEVEASEGIRTSLRLGDSALIVGEVRSGEAKALYEAMRVGALANVVAGTIHGDSPYGVFDRVVNDLGVPTTSFKATDIIVVANPVRTADGLHSVRRVMRITEVRKHWKEDPLAEGGFVDLMRYNVETDQLEPTPELLNGDSEILKAIAGNVKGWAGNWDAVWDNILLRAALIEQITAVAERLKKPVLLEAEFHAQANHQFHVIGAQVQAERGLPDKDLVLSRWGAWLVQAGNAF